MQKYGRITVIADAISIAERQRDGVRFVRMVKGRCDCGTEKVFRINHLRAGKTQSCGCLRIEIHTARLFKHGEKPVRGKGTVEYTAWRGMLSRCFQPSYHAFHHYGGRGITVCDRWRHDYSAFLSDVGRKPMRSMSLDRIDVNGNYKPGNVRWADRRQQSRNRRGVKPLTYEAVRHPPMPEPNHWCVLPSVRGHSQTVEV